MTPGGVAAAVDAGFDAEGLGAGCCASNAAPQRHTHAARKAPWRAEFLFADPGFMSILL
jgi:hypothetical protein